MNTPALEYIKHLKNSHLVLLLSSFAIVVVRSTEYAPKGQRELAELNSLLPTIENHYADLEKTYWNKEEDYWIFHDPEFSDHGPYAEVQFEGAKAAVNTSAYLFSAFSILEARRFGDNNEWITYELDGQTWFDWGGGVREVTDSAKVFSQLDLARRGWALAGTNISDHVPLRQADFWGNEWSSLTVRDFKRWWDNMSALGGVEYWLLPLSDPVFRVTCPETVQRGVSAFNERNRVRFLRWVNGLGEVENYLLPSKQPVWCLENIFLNLGFRAFAESREQPESWLVYPYRILPLSAPLFGRMSRFDESFPELSRITSGVPEARLDELEDLVALDASRASTKIAPLGLDFVPLTKIRFIGPSLILAQLFYFWIHISYWKPRRSTVRYPWIGCYGSFGSRLVFSLTFLVIPLACFFAAAPSTGTDYVFQIPVTVVSFIAVAGILLTQRKKTAGFP